MTSPLPKMHFRGSARSSSLITVPAASNYQSNAGQQGVTMLGNTILPHERKNSPIKENMSQPRRSSPNGHQNFQQSSPPLQAFNFNQVAPGSSPYGGGFHNQQQYYDPGMSPILSSHSNPLLAPRGSMMSPIFMPDPSVQPGGFTSHNKITPIAFNLGLPPQYYSQHVWIKDKKRKEEKEKEKEKDKKKKKEKNSDTKPLESLLGQYLDRQNQLMARIFRDIEDDKKRESLKKAYFENEADFAKGGYSNAESRRPSLSHSPSKHNRSSSLIPLKNSLPSQTRLTQEDDYYNSSSPNNPMMRRRPEGLNTDFANKLLRRDSNLGQKFSNRKPNRMRGRKLLKELTWGLALPSLWFLSVAKWNDERKESELKVLKDEIPEHLETFLEFAAMNIEKEIKNFVTDSSSMVIVQNSSLKPAELDRRCKNISEHLIFILDHLSLKMDSGQLPPSFFEFLAALSEDDAILPENFLSGFEISRLSFNMFGNLKHMDEWRSKMILASFLLIKGVLYFLMLRPWTVIPSVLEKHVNFKNILNAGSVLYHITLDLLSDNVPEMKKSKSEEIPFEPAPPTFTALEPNKLQKLDVMPDDDADDPDQIISGFYTRERVAGFLDERPKMVKEVRAAVLDFLDVLYDLSHHSLERKWHVKRRFADFRTKN